MTSDDLRQIDGIFTLNSRFLAAVIQEHGVRVKEQIELLTINFVCIGFAVGLFALPIIAESKHPYTGWTRWLAWLVWAVMWFGLSLFWHEQTTKVAERAANAERVIWSGYSRDPFEDYRKRTERIAETLKQQHGL